MINEAVIKEIYKRYGKKKKKTDLRLDYFIDLLKEHHHIKHEGIEILLEDLEEFNPFRRFLERSLNAVLEFDKSVAFVFRSHILFASKTSPDIQIHMRLEEPKSFLSRLFGR